MWKLLGTCPLFLICGTLPAQAPVTQPAVVLGRAPSACPVGFSARHVNGGALLNVSPASAPRGPAYDLRFIPRDGRGIVGAKVTLHGLSGHHVIPAGMSGAGSGLAEASETFTLAMRADERHLFTSVVHLAKLTGVTSVELNEITFANGAKWDEAAGSRCAVVPDGYMLVAGGR